MTIDESAATGNQQRRSRTTTPAHSKRAPLLGRLVAGEPYALAFGGQGGALWLTELAELSRDNALEPELTRLVNDAEILLAPIARELRTARSVGFDPIGWMLENSYVDSDAGDTSAGPSEAVLLSFAVVMPGILLTQLAALRSLRHQGLDFAAVPPAAVLGYSQGVLASGAVTDGAGDANLLAIAQLIGCAGTLVARRKGFIGGIDDAPMVAVANVDPDALRAIVAELSLGLDPSAAGLVAVRSSRRRVVLSGPPDELRRIRLRCAEITAVQTRERAAGTRGGTVFAPVFDSLAIEIGAHHPGLVDAVELVGTWAEKCGLDVAQSRALAQEMLVDPVDWVAAVEEAVEAGSVWILDAGPGDSLTRMTAPVLHGTGVGIIPAATRSGQRNLLTPGATPEIAPGWSSFAPRPVALPDGRVVTETAFTRLTGRSPILLAGMTPTTVDAAIVAAAANSGHWAELAGGGQVTEAIFADRIQELKSLLTPGRTVQFNALFLDPYLWKLQLGGKRVVQRARASGAPIDGIVVSAGIPELDEAVALIEELSEAGIAYIAFKPGTVAQIRSVVRIANEVPQFSVIVHIEGGRAGGHHSWEDLDDLLLQTYAELRMRPNVVVCVGGGIGTPRRSAEYLTGRWSRAHGYPDMPLDGILVGTAAMATLEAMTSPQVKQLLVDTLGTPDWVGSGSARGGMTSGRSQLGADIHEIDNAASQCGRLLDEVAGDSEKVAERRPEIIAALNKTAKPYFGDLDSMTYATWLSRYLELATFGAAGSVSDPAWLDPTWRERFRQMLQRAEARLHELDYGPIDTLFGDAVSLEQPGESLRALIARYPAAETALLHPADAPFFVTLCRSVGKPVNFVPVVDGDVRRWWRSDSLWQAHDSRYSADEVCIIPGTVAVAGITRVDEPVSDLLDRFEQATTDELLAGGAVPVTVTARRRAGLLSSPVDIVLGAPDVMWSGRLIRNPVARLGSPSEWVIRGMKAIHAPTGATVTELDVDHAELSVPLGEGAVVNIPITVPAAAHTGGAPVVTADDAAAAMSALLAITAGGNLPPADASVAYIEHFWSPDLTADHTGVTGAGLPPTLRPVPGNAPDVLVGACWPAVFAVLGAARTPHGEPVVEGMLDLVHLDHQIHVRRELPVKPTILVVRAEAGEVRDTVVGRVVEVRAVIRLAERTGPVLAELVERFAIRGRTGAQELTDPSRAGGAVGVEAAETARRRRRHCTIVAPADMGSFAEVSGDHNPIHGSVSAALLAGIGEPIVHGMWLSAAAQQVVSAMDTAGVLPPRRLDAWTVRFLGMVRPGAEIDVRVDRVGQCAGAEIVEVSCRVADELVMTATGRTVPPKTIYAFPGQGIQAAGMGLDARARSKAAREIWDRADTHTRDALGFSILAVVRDNPTRLVALGCEYRHPAGVLHLTQFTQVAMATLGAAQVAELRESGAFVEGALLAGHSVGEYNALTAVSGAFPLEQLLEIVFQRGSAMHELVPRDAEGNSDYRMAAIRPSQFDLADVDVQDFIAAVAADSGEYLEVVNLNLLGSQYAIAGTIAGLEALEIEIDRRRAAFGGKRAFILVPGIDVPFHSTVLRKGVPEFRRRLDDLLPTEIDPQLLVGRYIPNLVPRPFSLHRDFIQEIADLVPSEPLIEVLADFDSWAARPQRLCRIVLMELLAWQFASPVRWIETQDLMFTPESRGGLGVERFVEIGLSATPTVANLAAQTLKLSAFEGSRIEVLNIERDAAVVYATDVDVEMDEELLGEEPAPESADSLAAVAAAPVAAPVGAPRPDDVPFTAADATRVLIASWTKLRLEQIGPADTIESLCDGVSSRRNQLLVDLGAELSLGAIDGASDADMATLSDMVGKLARTYKPFGPVLNDSFNDHLRTIFGPSGRRASAVAERVRKTWQLADGWVSHVMAEIALGTREGVSVRGGDLGGLVDSKLLDGASVDGAIDAAVQAFAARRGIAVALPATAPAAGAAVDSAALSEFTEQISGRNGVLASAARLVLEQLGLSADPVSAEVVADTDLIDAVSAELGGDWLRVVAPAFDARRAVLIDDRWATAREDLARLWLGAEVDVSGFVAAGTSVAAQAKWWQRRARAEGRQELASTYERIAADAARTEVGEWSEDVAVITGASKGSIAAALTAKLLGGGATVFVTTSRLDDERLDFYRGLYRTAARSGAQLWVVPANMASYRDVDALIEWIGSDHTDTVGGIPTLLREAVRPTLLFPFAAPRVQGELSDAGGRAEMEMRVLLWSVERLIAGMSQLSPDSDLGAALHVVLPGSPNRGMFGGDGAYGEAKSALDAIVAKWSTERSWADRVTLVHAIIGWVRGTGLMAQNDPIVDAVEEAGVRTWSATEIAGELLNWSTKQVRIDASAGPREVDLTGGLVEAGLDLPALARRFAAATATADDTAASVDDDEAIIALPAPPSVSLCSVAPQWPSVAADPADLVVVVGAAELGPYGSSRTRFEMEVEEKLSAAGVLELAWTTGLVVWEADPTPGWYDRASGDLVAEQEIVERYHDAVVARCGIRRYEDDGPMVENTAPLLQSVFLDHDLTFVVSGAAEARAFQLSDPDRTVIAAVPDSAEWQVTRKAGTEIRIPRKVKLTRTVGGQIPTGFDPLKWGISPDMVATIDRVSLWNIVTTVDAFIGAGLTPSELMEWVHPRLVANTQGTGMGGMSSIRAMNIGAVLGEPHPNDTLQEALGNVIAAHVAQSYVGGYGAMVHPVGACATAAVSVEEAVDKIRLGKAKFVVAGGFDDMSPEAMQGFADMSATADTAAMNARGISDRRISRANDRRRGGFVESHGGGTVLLARGDVALEMGLPVLGVIAHAQSFGDGLHTSIPAPGLGALGVACGGADSELAVSLRALGVGADDVAIISKHDTSTAANDPNEAELHERIAAAIGRADGAPLFVVSQKSLTGHAKGGAAAFQLIGLCQMLSQGVVPPNRSLDCVDDAMAEFPHLVWPREPLRFGDKFPLKAGLVTSLGFGHVSGLIAVVHPEAFLAAISPADRADYRRRAEDRARSGRQRLADAMCGGAPMYTRPVGRRLGEGDAAHALEAQVLLSKTARLGKDGVYVQVPEEVSP